MKPTTAKDPELSPVNVLNKLHIYNLRQRLRNKISEDIHHDFEMGVVKPIIAAVSYSTMFDIRSQVSDNFLDQMTALKRPNMSLIFNENN